MAMMALLGISLEASASESEPASAAKFTCGAKAWQRIGLRTYAIEPKMFVSSYTPTDPDAKVAVYLVTNETPTEKFGSRLCDVCGWGRTGIKTKFAQLNAPGAVAVFLGANGDPLTLDYMTGPTSTISMMVCEE